MPSRLPGLRKTAVGEPLAGQGQPGSVQKDGGRIGLRSYLGDWSRPAASRAVAARGWYGERPWLPGYLFAALTQLPALLVVAWLLRHAGNRAPSVQAETGSLQIQRQRMAFISTTSKCAPPWAVRSLANGLPGH